MPKIEDFAFYGASGHQYIFQVYPIGTEFKNISGVYIFTRREMISGDGITHNLLYIGQAKSLMVRLKTYHEKWDAVLRNGGNCVCVYSVPHEEVRNTIENDLIHKYLPPLNMRK